MISNPPTDTAVKSGKSTGDDLPESVIIRAYPNAVFMYPVAVCALVCAVLQMTTGVGHETLGFVFMCVFMFNLCVLAFEFTRNVSVAMFLGGLAAILLGILINERLQLTVFMKNVYLFLSFNADAGFYFGIFGCFVIVFAGVVIDTRFDYWELRGNEILHHHGFLGDVERFPAQQLQLKKEITDVFEYLLLHSGRLIIYTRGNDRPIVLDNVPRINIVEEMITQKLHTLKVTIQSGGD